jgi:hypothetical protein
VLCVGALVAPNTINTVLEETLRAFANDGWNVCPERGALLVSLMAPSRSFQGSSLVTQSLDERRRSMPARETRQHLFRPRAVSAHRAIVPSLLIRRRWNRTRILSWIIGTLRARRSQGHRAASA